MYHDYFCRRVIRGARLIKTSRGLISFATVIGTALLVSQVSALAQIVPLGCLPGSTGLTPGSPTPYAGGMCDLGTLRANNFGFSQANGVSANGGVVVGEALTNTAFSRAFLWTGDGMGMVDLGSLRADNLGSSAARTVSADGSTIVGRAQVNFLNSRAFRWINDGTGMLDLGSLRADNLGNSQAQAVSADGSVIVGVANADGLVGNRAFRWMDNGTGMLDLGSLRADNLGTSNGFAVSADGSVIVGGAETDTPNTSRAFRWIDNGAGMLDLGSLRADNLGYSFAQALSADGSTITGVAQTDNFSERAFRWIDDGTGMLDLGTLRVGNFGTSNSLAVSANGSVIVGRSDTDDGGERAFRWIDNGTGMLDLGSLRTDNLGNSRALAVSADGGVIVGQANTDDANTRAFHWIDDGTGMLDLGSLRLDNLGFSAAQNVSADGSTVVGLAEANDGNLRAFIWRKQLPETPVPENPEMEDFENLIVSYPVLAIDTEIAVAQQQMLVGRLMSETCVAENGQSCLRLGGWLANADSAGSQDVGRRNSGMSMLTLGHSLGGQTTIGGTLSVNGSSLSSNSFDMGTGVGGSLWGKYSESGLDRTGLQAGAAIGWGRESGTITRGLGLDNVMLATGNASLESFGGHATLGYGFQQQGWLITPSATLKHINTNRSAYAEDGAAFNASYDALAIHSTTVTLTLSGEHKVGEQGTFSIGIGAEHDLTADHVVLTGTSTIPGMDSFSASSTLERNRTRGFLDLGYSHDLGGNNSLSGNLRVGQSSFGAAPQVSLGAYYGMRF